MAKTSGDGDLHDSNNLISRFKAQRISRALDGALDVSATFPGSGIKLKINLSNSKIKVTWFILSLKELIMWSLT